jgi:adenylate kinase
MILVFLGPPGSGKGTQAKLLAEKLVIPHISLGDILREEVRLGTQIGKQAEEIMNAGKLVPDELTIALTWKRINNKDCKSGFILDGFPRSDIQAGALDKMLKDLKVELDKVIYFRLTEDEAVLRLSARRSCKRCGAVYHMKFNPPKIEGICDKCGEKLFQRKDDEEKAVRTRFAVYEKQTKPLVDHYEKLQKLAAVDAGGSIEAVFASLLAEIGYGRD